MRALFSLMAMALIVVASSCNNQTPADTATTAVSKDSVAVSNSDPLPSWNDGQLKRILSAM